jgi:energy-coupling factor transporter ATP-binding protein EcfA2
MRKAQTEMPTLTSLGLTPIFGEMARQKNGLILVTGATGSGKTTTLSAILNEINETQAVHVVTLEDPIEFVHAHKRATFNQRELGMDFDTFPKRLRSALRQAPKVILVGEMRDRATVEIALTAAETGHLVLSTIHTINAGQSINRILGMFELAEETQLRLQAERNAPLRGQPAPRAEDSEEGGSDQRNHGLQPAGAGSDCAGRGRGAQFLRHHRGERDLWLGDVRSIALPRLPGRAHHRGDRGFLRHEQSEDDAVHRQREKAARPGAPTGRPV